MVGVPGRSRGCVTCKKRRIACDIQGPPCGQCARSRRTCSFPSRHIFVLNETNSYKTIYKKQKCFTEADADQSHKNAAFDVNPRNPSTSDQIVESLSTQVISRPFGTLTALRELLMLNACAENPIVTHEPYHGRPWTLMITAFANSVHALNSAPLASYASWAGRRNRDPYLVEVSQRLYVQGLREVQQAVNEPRTVLRDETFGACLALIIYEALECPDSSRRGYNAHVDGCSKLVRLRGASMHQEGVSHNLFCTFRYIDIIRAFETRRPTHLSSKAWTTLPWQKHDKTNWDRLIDLLAEGPSILKQGDKLETLPPHERVSTVIEMIEELLALENRMLVYRSNLSSSHQGPLYWEAASPITAIAFTLNGVGGGNGSKLPALHFHDIEVARSLTLYWSMLSMIYSGLNDLWGAMQSFLSQEIISVKFGRIYHSLAFQPMDWLDPVRKVCRSIDYCNSNIDGSVGIGNVVIAVPLDVVLGVMKNRTGCDEEYRTARRARGDISRNWLRVLQFSPQDI